MPTIKYTSLSDAPSMRKFAMGAWKKPNDPSAHVQMDLDITPVMTFLEAHKGIELRHVIIKCIAKVLDDIPGLNRVFIRRKLRQRVGNRLFIPSVIRQKRQMDLSGVFMDNAHQLSLKDVAKEFKQKVSDLRTRRDKPTWRAIALFRWMPFLLCKPVIRMLDMIQYSFNVSLSGVGLPSDPFGTLSLTFLDQFNIRYAYIPIFSFSRSTMTVAVGQKYKVDEKMMLPLCFTFDHRCFDGVDGAVGVKRLQYYFNHPEKL